MQRPFVWKEDRVYRLLDSLLRKFPIGAVMLWKTSSLQRYRRMQRDIDIVIGIYLSIMSGVFSGAEAKMGAFARNIVSKSQNFPLQELASLVKRQYGIDNLDKLLRRHLDLALNIAHGGITLDKNPEELQRDHIFPRSKLEAQGLTHEVVNHYANFHFLRAKDNGNKSDRPPHEWFRKPGTNTPYTDRDLEERLLTWKLLEPEAFPAMLEQRGRKIRQKAEALFGVSEAYLNSLFR